MSLTGGKNVNAVVPKILDKFFTSELAAKYNWTGKKKRELRHLKLMTLLFSKQTPIFNVHDWLSPEKVGVFPRVDFRCF